MKTITTFKQIKEIIEPIPFDKFCIGKYQNYYGQRCFLGHIHKHIDGDAYCGDGRGNGARALTQRFLADHGILADGADVNDGNDIEGYTEPIIKHRLMHMIEDGIKWEESNSN